VEGQGSEKGKSPGREYIATTTELSDSNEQEKQSEIQMVPVTWVQKILGQYIQAILSK
jgi:hypothetical protein